VAGDEGEEEGEVSNINYQCECHCGVEIETDDIEKVNRFKLFHQDCPDPMEPFEELLESAPFSNQNQIDWLREFAEALIYAARRQKKI
jgi:hypothetical protein